MKTKAWKSILKQVLVLTVCFSIGQMFLQVLQDESALLTIDMFFAALGFAIGCVSMLAFYRGIAAAVRKTKTETKSK